MFSVVWAEETGALCLRWVDHDSSAASVWNQRVWTEWILFVKAILQFLSLLVLSACICFYTLIALQRTFQPFCFLSPFLTFLFLNHILSILLWPQKFFVEEGRVRLELGKKKQRQHDSWIDATPANMSVTGMTGLPLVSYSTSQCIFQNTQTFPFVCMHRASWLEGFPLPWMTSCSGLFLRSCSAVQASPES